MYIIYQILKVYNKMGKKDSIPFAHTIEMTSNLSGI